MTVIRAQGLPVADILALPALRGVRLLAGRGGLHRFVTDVSVLEAASVDHASFVGGELVVGKGPKGVPTEEWQANLVQRLHQDRVAALALRVDARPDADPRSAADPRSDADARSHAERYALALQLADQAHLPVLLLPDALPLAQLFHAVLGEILQRQTVALERTEEAHRRVMQLALDDADVEVIVADMAAMFHKALALFTRQGALLAAAHPEGDAETLERLVDQAPFTESFVNARRVLGLAPGSEPVVFSETVHLGGATGRDRTGTDGPAGDAAAGRTDGLAAARTGVLTAGCTGGPGSGRIWSQIVVPLQAGNKPDMFFVLWTRDSAFHEWELRALLQSSVPLLAAKRQSRVKLRSPQHVEQRIVQQLFDEFPPDEGVLLGMAAQHGIDLTGPHRVLVIQGGDEGSGQSHLIRREAASQRDVSAPRESGARGNAPTRADMDHLAALLHDVRRLIASRHRPAIVGRWADKVVAIIPVNAPSDGAGGAGGDTRAAGGAATLGGGTRRSGKVGGRGGDVRRFGGTEAPGFGAELRQHIVGGLKSTWPGVTVGVSRICAGVAAISAAFQEARQTAWIGLRLFGPGQAYPAEQLWYFRVLLEAAKHDLVDDGWQTLLQRLREEDNEAGGYLLETLDAFLDCQQSFTETAKMLFVHPNTVRYRIEKVKAIMGKQIFIDPMMRLGCHLALKAVRLLDAPAPGSDAAAEAPPGRNAVLPTAHAVSP